MSISPLRIALFGATGGTSNLDWTLVRPPHLTDAEPAAALVYGADFDPAQMTMKIARADVARSCSGR